MKLIFANRNYSSWSLRAWLVLRHFGIPFDEELVLLNGEGWQARTCRKKSPSGKVPVLVDGDVVRARDHGDHRVPQRQVSGQGASGRRTAIERA